MTYNQKYRGVYYSLVGGVQYMINAAGNMAAAYTASGSERVCVLTGYSLTTNRGTVMQQTTAGSYIDLSDGWKPTGQTASLPTYSTGQAQSLVNTIIKNNRKILENQLLCAKFKSKLSQEQRDMLLDLQGRLQARDKSLRMDGLCGELKESYPAGYVYLQSYLEEAQSGIGLVVSTTAMLVISAVVIASLSTAAYFAYKAMAKESEDDVVFSDELTKSLVEKLTPEEFEQLRKETAGIVTQSKIQAKLGSYGTMIKYVAIGAAVLAGISLIRKFSSK